MPDYMEVDCVRSITYSGAGRWVYTVQVGSASIYLDLCFAFNTPRGWKIG
jgi:hypothetical protein